MPVGSQMFVARKQNQQKKSAAASQMWLKTLKNHEGKEAKCSSMECNMNTDLDERIQLTEVSMRMNIFAAYFVVMDTRVSAAQCCQHR